MVKARFQASAHGETIDAFLKRKPEAAQAMNDFLKAEKLSKENVRLYPLHARLENLTVALNAASGAVLKVLPINPD